MKIEILGAHNSETDKARLPSLLVDDIIALDAGGLTSSLSLQRQHQITSVLLTHHHFDHTRDLVTLGSNDTHPPSTVDVYGLPETLEVVYKYLLDGKMYKDYTQWPKVEAPRLLLKPLEPYQHTRDRGLRDHARTGQPFRAFGRFPGYLPQREKFLLYRRYRARIVRLLGTYQSGGAVYRDNGPEQHGRRHAWAGTPYAGPAG